MYVAWARIINKKNFLPETANWIDDGPCVDGSAALWTVLIFFFIVIQTRVFYLDFFWNWMYISLSRIFSTVHAFQIQFNSRIEMCCFQSIFEPYQSSCALKFHLWSNSIMRKGSCFTQNRILNNFFWNLPCVAATRFFKFSFFRDVDWTTEQPFYHHRHWEKQAQDEWVA